MGGLRVDSPEAIQKGGKSGPMFTAGDPESSLLLRALRYGDKLKMPPSGKLSDEQIADFVTWIRAGVPMPSSTAAKAGSNHWAFRPVLDNKVPAVKRSAWVRSPIDAFILAKLETKGLDPAPPADKRTWLRRVTF
ncbi:MAG TPA: c-type cytochrome domain-containing protein, partial [Bryobacteraceae bacterium]|nr:c-type cytochrome domain-containing protein [Bryobacteraceae bacterium]